MPNNKKIASYFFYVGLYGLSASISISKFGTSLGMILLSFSWFLEWNWEEKKKLFQKNKFFLILSTSLFIIFVVGIFHSANIAYGIKDLKIKAPLFILPVVFGLSGIKRDKKIILIALVLFSAFAVIASVIGFVSYQIQTGKGAVLDLRTMSPFISLIRLSLILCFGFGFSLWGIIKFESRYKWLLLIFNFWILYFIVISESLTGIVLLPIISIYFLLFVIKRDAKLAISFGAVILGLATFMVIELKEISTLVFTSHIPEIKEYTLSGRKYNHTKEALFRENGHLIFDNFCHEEMEQEWNKRSLKKYKSLFKGYDYSSILMRYLSSRGLDKDSVGISKLSTEEIKAIENGVTNVYYLNNNPLFKRMHVGFMELRDAYELERHSGRSIASRFVYFASGYEIFKDNFWFGVGTGDVRDSFLAQHKKSRFLQKGCDKKSHNQFLTVALSLGIFGILIFLTLLILILNKYNGSLNYLFFLGQIIVLSSMVWEDTLETQAGVAVFSLLLNLFIFERKKLKVI